jgi:hypothetical protein
MAESVLAATREELRCTKDRICGLNAGCDQVKEELAGIQREMKELCVSGADDIARSEWGASFREDGQRLKSCLDRVETCRRRNVRPGLSGILDWMGRAFDTWDAEQEADSAAVALASVVIAGGGSDGVLYPRRSIL